MVQEYEDLNIIPPPPKFRDDYQPPVSTSEIEIITPLQEALKGSVKSYEVCIKNEKGLLAQLNNRASLIENFIESILKERKGLKFYQTIAVTFIKKKKGTSAKRNYSDVEVEKYDFSAGSLGNRISR